MTERSLTRVDSDLSDGTRSPSSQLRKILPSPTVYGTRRYTKPVSLRFKTRGELRNLDHLRAGLRMLKVSKCLGNGTMWNEDISERESWY